MAEQQNQKMPQIRFKGFFEEWEDKKLGDIYHFKYGHFNNNPSDGGKYPVYGANGIIGSYSNYNAEDSIIIGHMGEYAGSVLWGKGKHFVTYNGTISTPKGSEINPEFGYYMFDQFNIREICGGSGQPFLSYKTLQRINAAYPISTKEQFKIRAYFAELDWMIGLHQRKHEKLVTLKKAMFKKMFPQNGATAPEIRFKGFSKPWEETTLGEITERVQGNDGRMDLPTLTISASSGWLDQRDRFYSNIAGKEQKNYTLLKKGHLSYNHGNSKLAKYGVVFELASFEEALVPRVYHSFKAKEETNPSFIEYLFAAKIPDKELGKLISSGARMDGLLNISYTDFMGICISITSKDEQQKIGTYFRQLDELIDQHNAQIDKLKQLKTGCLQKMFV